MHIFAPTFHFTSLMRNHLLNFTRLLLFAVGVCVGHSASAIIWHYDNFNTSKLECAITSWSGSQPSSGKLTIPSSYTHTDGKTYSVVNLAAHALDGLDEVTQVTIPASVRRIGETGKGMADYDCNMENFSGCTQMKTYIVDSANEYFASTDDGLLVSKNKKLLYKVPAKLAVTNNAYTVASIFSRITTDAFEDNTTIKTLTLPADIIVDYNGGFNKMKNLAQFKLTGEGTLKVSSGLLLDIRSDYKTAISLPPASETSSLSLTSQVVRIENYAFYKCSSLKSFSMTAPEYIGKYAFSCSGVTEIRIPSSVTQIGEAAFEGCTSLTALRLDLDDYEIPARFARKCSSLDKVTLANAPVYIRESAFKDCRVLSSFPFTAVTEYEDSTFYDCGFQQIAFKASVNNDYKSGVAVFAANRYLNTLDLSAIDTSGGNTLSIGDSFAADCGVLKTILFPANLDFWVYTDDRTTPPAFGRKCAATRIVFHEVANPSGKQQFIYTGSGSSKTYRPDVFVALTAIGSTVWELRNLFGGTDGASVLPRVFVDVYSPEGRYYDEDATYFVPGGAVNNYSKATQIGCTVSEMFKISFSESSGKLSVSVNQNNVNSVVGAMTNVKVSFNGGTASALSLGGTVSSTIPYSQVTSVTLNYAIDGVAMSTVYPQSHWTTSSIGSVTATEADDDGDALYFTPDGRPATPASRGVIITVKPGAAPAKTLRN